MKTSTAQALAELNATGQDFEWYPTTNEIIDTFFDHASNFELESILDVGSGDGKVLKRFKDKHLSAPKLDWETRRHIDYFAIEKARPLLDSLPIDIGILGTDFWEQSLLDKSVDCIFSNPPYKEFIDWSVKVIREANCSYIYLVLPQRWKEQKPIIAALESRKAGYKVLGEFDFLNSEDRQARARVDLVYIWLCHVDYSEKRSKYAHGRTQNLIDPFDLWVKEFFGLEENNRKLDISECAQKKEDDETRKANIENSLVPGNGMIEVLDELYREELNGLIENYKKVCSLDEALFKELDISVKSIISSIKVRVSGLKNSYWNELFSNYSPLTGRLTAASRKNFIESIRRKTNIDFTASNAYAITVWAIKNADGYLDKQMIDTFKRMVDSASIINYKSNEKVFKKNSYMYFREDYDKHTHFKLDYRLVISRTGGGLNHDRWASRGGLTEESANFIDDLIVIAKNLGFNSDDCVRNHNFTAGQKEEFYCTTKAGKHLKLMELRVYMNGNMHVKFNQSFMLAFNVEVGRLRGWIHNAQHAAAEMDVPVEEVKEYLNSSYSLANDSQVAGLLMLAH
ncbi:DUF4942 domain-containing protein [Nitrosomonas ureae]|uniref:DUF4942 domain-containing protein n=1 Tax=Nitrosomonas ureae TaxID=44577 RepID=A0A1H2ENU4_9PROT|nr:DUF4942 domain-containing protein [Nitrosomonas ureae]ALQ51911.1 hypothetical protein ATY38_12185 [Nitrosomonas ureae]SDT96689.1 protein of unknown function [Nitrosomonas ureae]